MLHQFETIFLVEDMSKINIVTGAGPDVLISIETFQLLLGNPNVLQDQKGYVIRLTSSGPAIFPQ